MSDVFEVAFSGEIAPGADLSQVRASVGKMFKADETKLDQLFSGKRIVIKKNIDEQTALKYKAALSKAGAVCEVLRISTGVEEVQAAPPPQETSPSAPAAAPAVAGREDYADRDIPPAPQTVPLQVSGEQIADLGADLAPVGSDMQELVEEDIPPPSVPDDMTVAPPGAELTDHRPANEPPPPDTSGLSLVDD